MRKTLIIPLVCITCTLVACIDSDYDLSNIETDDIAIGDSQSEFNMPVATVYFTSQNICNGAEGDEISLKKIYDEVDIWFPSSMVDGNEYIEIFSLLDTEDFDQQYLDNLVQAVKDEIANIEQKREQIAMHIATKYRNRFINLIWDSNIDNKAVIAAALENATDEEAAEIIAELIVEYSDEAEQAVAELFTLFLTKLSLVDIHTTVPEIELSADVRDMILDNLDDSSVENPVNSLYIYGVADSEFPFEFEITPCIPETNINFGTITINRGTTDIAPIRIMREDMQALLDGFTVKVPITTVRYYPHEEFTDQTKFSVTFKIRKTGALQL